MSTEKEMEALVDEWCDWRNKTSHDINYGSGDFYWEHLVSLGLWLEDRLVNK